MPSTAGPGGSAAPHPEVVHAMESVTGASLETTKPKPSRPKHASSGGGGNYGRSSSSSPPPPPPEPELPESGRLLGVRCSEDDQCATHWCSFDHCAKRSYMDKVTDGEKCDYDHDCISDHCYHDVCEKR